MNNDTDEIVERYIKLFRGRGDAVGTWAGGAQRCAVNSEHFFRHLTSSNPQYWIGTYPHLGDRGVSWGCIDIDGGDFPLEMVVNHADYDRKDPQWHDWQAMDALAKKLIAVLQFKSVYAHQERTRNGFHLWVFPEAGIVPAAAMRRSLMAACKACSYDPKEVNPKSEELLPGKLGNYVRLPYPGARSDTIGSRDVERYFLDGTNGGQMLTLSEFLDSVKLTATAALDEVAQLWTPPVVATFDGPPPEDVAPLITRLDGLSYTIWSKGPLAGRDRSNTLAKLAYRLRDNGWAMPDAFAVVKDADSRWGKFSDRPDVDEQILAIVQLAYVN